jgi:hypothetical protein
MTDPLDESRAKRTPLSVPTKSTPLATAGVVSTPEPKFFCHIPLPPEDTEYTVPPCDPKKKSPFE